jgi:hypothetical protein
MIKNLSNAPGAVWKTRKESFLRLRPALAAAAPILPAEAPVPPEVLPEVLPEQAVSLREIAVNKRIK